MKKRPQAGDADSKRRLMEQREYDKRQIKTGQKNTMEHTRRKQMELPCPMTLS